MQQKKQKTTTPKVQQKNPNASTTSRIDLETMTLRELIALRDQVDAALADIYALNMQDTDISLEYNVKLRTKQGTVSSNTGNIQLNRLLHPRLIAEAPGRLEQEFSQQVFAPVSAALYDLLDEHNPTDYSINALRQQIGRDNEPPSLPVSVSTFPDAITI